MTDSKMNKRMKMLWKTIAFCLLIMLVPAGVLIGQDIRDGDNVQVQKDETVKGPGFYAGSRVQIDGTVDGTTFAFGEEIRINGTINGDLIVAGRYVTIDGKILGNLYSASQFQTISGQVGGDVFGAAQNITFADDAVLQRDLLLAGQFVNYSGQVQRQLLATGQDIKINGSVGDDVRLSGDKLAIQDQAVIGGDIFYESANQAFVAGGAQVSGITDWKKIDPKQSQVSQKDFKSEFFWLLLGLVSALLIWFLVTVWRPQLWEKTQRQISNQPLKTIGVGVLGLIVIPILAIILMITVIGLPLGIILILAYGVLIYLAKIIVAVFIGSWLAERFAWPQIHKGVWLVLLSLAVIALLTEIPVLGIVISLLVIFAGLGSVILVALKPDISKPEI